ncbi:Methyltransferase type 11 [Candidatus Magnetoovum chiemensis]|nr:Methyltransferase type 11 [Candidatus Magnetoovum chiemensis]
MKRDNLIKQYYDNIASVYDSKWKGYVGATLKYFVDNTNLSDAQTVLNVACGSGELEKLLLAKYHNLSLYGIDISDNMLNIAKTKLSSYENVYLQKSSAQELPFNNNMFDSVVSTNSFHIFNNPDKVIKEIYRVTKPQGSVIIMDWCKDYIICRLYDIVLKLIDKSHKMCYTKKECSQFLDQSGFTISTHETFRIRTFWGLMIFYGIKK